MMAVYGAPLRMESAESAQKAVQTLRDMHAGLQFLNDKWQTRLQRPLCLKAAVHQGKVIVGSFGCERRTDFTALGLPVQVTDALESSAHASQCLIAESILPFVQGVAMRDLGPQQVKGLSRPLRVSELILEANPAVKAHAS